MHSSYMITRMNNSLCFAFVQGSGGSRGIKGLKGDNGTDGDIGFKVNLGYLLIVFVSV